MLQSLTALPEKISGYDLANHLLSQGGVEALIRYAGNAETDWLELKAGMCLLPEDRKKGETERDLYWNIAKEVIALMNTSGGALVIGIHDKTLNLVPLEENDPRHILAEKGIDGYVREFVRSNVWTSSLSWTYRGKTWELADKQVPTDLISYHHAPYSGPDGRTGEVVVLLVKLSEKIRLAKEDRKSSVLLKRTRGEVGEAVPIYDYDEFDKYKASREVVSAFYANVRDQFDREHAAASDSAKLDSTIQNYYSGLAVKARKMMAVFTPLDAEENVFSKDDVDQFYSPEAIETFDDEDRWLDDDEEEDREDDEEEDEEDSGFDEDGDEGVLDSEDDTEDEEDARSARKGDLLELLKSEQRVIESGEPGGGKTTCLTYFTLKFAERGDGAPILAVFIPMGQWRRGGSLSLMMERATEMDAGQLAHLMSENRLRLVIDAVNECPDDFRVAAIQNIGIFLAEHPTVPAVISTRHPKELSALHLPVFHVRPMDEEHRLHYLERYLQDGGLAKKLLLQLGGMPGGETVAENPMLLRLVVEVYKKSPEKRLPNGRAGLYRRSLRAWYKRENEKAEKSGTKLQWNRRQIFELLAKLAFKSRQLGYRDVPLDSLPGVWGKGAENQLEALCQGPIIYCDNEFVRFRHETFQEYLCAEYLVAHQDELPALTQDDYAQWGMPFAYSIELLGLDNQQLPESFWQAAWRLNPWLGVVLTDEGKGRKLLRPNYQGARPKVNGQALDRRLKAIYLWAVCGTLNRNNSVLRRSIGDKLHQWYLRNDVALRYVVFVSSTCQDRWRRFETMQLSCLTGLSLGQATKLSKNWFTVSEPREVFQHYAYGDWNGWIVNATPETAIALVNSRLALPSDFSDVKKRWLPNIKLNRCLRLVKAGILHPSDVCERIPAWIAAATPESAARMIESGLVSRESFEEQINKWCESVTPELAASVIRNGIVPYPVFEGRIREWRKSATPESAVAMIEMGLATKDEFQAQIQKWVRQASYHSARMLIRLGLAQKDDFKNEISGWVDMATPDMACELIDGGLAIPGDFKMKLSPWLTHPQYSFVRKFLNRHADSVANGLCADKHLVCRWIESAGIDSAISLIRDELATRDDFTGVAGFWADFSSKDLWGMATVGLITQNTAMQRATVEREVQSAINSRRVPTDTEKQQWLACCSFSSLVGLINLGLVSMGDARRRIACWKEHASPQMACELISSGFAHPADFRSQVAQWKNSLSPNDALALIRCGIIELSEVSALKESWRKNISPDTLLSAVQLGCLKIDDVARCLSLWGDAVLAEDRQDIMKFLSDDVVESCDSYFMNGFPPETFCGSNGGRMLVILLGLQHAHNLGDPDLASALVDQYHSLRPRIFELDRDLCAYADLNLAVHHHDSFEFDKALSLVDGWINGPLFSALSVMNRGRMFSSRGQSLALLGRNQEADEAFARALSIFSVEPELLVPDIAQTKTYQAMNALDRDAPSAVPLVEGLLGKSLIATAFNLTALLERPFAAHLFLKALWRMREGRSDVLDALIKNLPVDIEFRKQHPYEMILFYLALLVKDTNPSYAEACARKMEQFFDAIEFGGTLGLVHSYMRIMLKRHGVDVVADTEFFGELDIVEYYLSDARTIVERLRAGWADVKISVERVLPFNCC